MSEEEVSESGSEKPYIAAHMAVRIPTPVINTAQSLGAVPKARPLRRPREGENTDMEWTFPDEVTMPEGGETRFTETSFQGETFWGVTLEFPNQYHIFKASRTKTQQMLDYINWVEQHFTYDPTTKQVRQTVRTACTHPKATHKGSNHYVLKSKCLVWFYLGGTKVKR